MSEMSENYKLTSKSDFPLTTSPVSYPSKLVLGSEDGGDEKTGGKSELLANAIFILCICDQWYPVQALTSLRGNYRTALCRMDFFTLYLVGF